MTVVGTLLMDKSGRRPLLMVSDSKICARHLNCKYIDKPEVAYQIQISAAGTCLGCFLTGLSFLLQVLFSLTPNSHPQLLLLIFMGLRKSSSPVKFLA